VINDTELTIDIQMILESLNKDDHICFQIVKLYIEGHNIKNICKTLKMSRFKVKRRLDKGLEYIRKIAQEERVFVPRSKFKKRR
jgi:DNA-directed RNA polymerase specialized sigma24 family protein